MMVQKKRVSFKKFPLFLIFALCCANFSLFAHAQVDSKQFIDTNPSLTWTQGYTLVLLKASDGPAVQEARNFIIKEGGTVAIYSKSHALLGWIPAATAAKMIGQHGIEAIHYNPIDPETLRHRDAVTVSFVRFFNSVATGEIDRQYFLPHQQGDPLINDALEHPFVNPENIVENLKNKNVNWAGEAANLADNAGIFPGYSDSMTGTIAFCLFFVESNGSIDSNLYTWTTAARDFIINQCLAGASWWSNKAGLFGQTASFDINFYSPDSDEMQQGYEPILHNSGEDSLWINRVMANLGFSSGSHLSRVTAFNAWLKSREGTQWAYSCFFCYNPPGASTTFTDGYFAYAYLGGPYIQMLYRNDGWPLETNWSIFAHESGHIFWACDEYYQAGYGGCTSCAPCSTYRPVNNGNCEHPSCNPSGSVPCMMKSNSNNLCLFTVAQVGWELPAQELTIQAGPGGTTNPRPGTYTHNRNSSVTVTAVPAAHYRFQNWSGDATGTKNPLKVVLNRDKTVKANFFHQYILTLKVSAGGTTTPSAGTHQYDPGTTVQVGANPNDYYYFTGWSGATTGKTNPIPILMNGDKNLQANFRLIAPPLNVTGQKVLNRSLSQAQYINILTWASNPDNVNIAHYKIYLLEGNQKTEIVVLGADTFSYWHRPVEKDKEYTYAIAAVNNEAREGAPATIVVR